MWYRAKGWDVWLALGFAVVLGSLIAFQRWWALAIQIAWLGGYLLWRRTRRLAPPPAELPAPSPPPTEGSDESGWTFERNPDGSYTWTNTDGRRVVMD